MSQVKYSPLDLCFMENYGEWKQNGSKVIANMLVSWLGKSPINHHANEIKTCFHQCIDLPSFDNYMDARDL